MFSECPPKKRPYILKTLTPPEFQKWQKLALTPYIHYTFTMCKNFNTEVGGGVFCFHSSREALHADGDKRHRPGVERG